MKFLEELAARRRFGMKMGLDTIRSLCAALGEPQRKLGRVIHVAGTNGKGAVCAMLDVALQKEGRVGRYTSPHLVKLNERFFVDGAPIDDVTLESAAERVYRANAQELTFFEALTAVGFLICAEQRVDWTILECGLGGRLDATNICEPRLSIITRIGLDHCDWLGDTVEKIASEKAGIIKAGIPVVLGCNVPSVQAVIRQRAQEVGAPYYYAPDLVDEGEVPSGLPLGGKFNQENAITAIAVLKILEREQLIQSAESCLRGFGKLVWPGRFQRVGRFLIDGAHNPPAAKALADSLVGKYNVVAGFCGDKDIDEVLRILLPFVNKAFAVKTNNPRSLPAEEVANKMRSCGYRAEACDSLGEALKRASEETMEVLVCGSLFLAGEALVELNAYPWGEARYDAAELLKGTI